MQLLLRTATPPGGSGQWDSCNTLPLCLGAAGCATCNALPHCLGAVGSATPAIHCLTAQGQWAVELLLNTASPPGGSGQWSCRSCCNALLLCLGAVGSATPALRCLTSSGQWAVEILQCTASLPGGSGLCYSCNTLPHCLGAVGSGTPAIHCLTAWGGRQCNSCSALPRVLLTHPGGGGGNSGTHPARILAYPQTDKCPPPTGGGGGADTHPPTETCNTEDQVFHKAS